MTPRLFALTLLSLLAFAGNSLLCRIALKQTPIDPTSFVAIRLLSGALILWLVLYLQRQSRNLEGSWFGALALLAYAMTFAYAYSQIPAGTGAAAVRLDPDQHDPVRVDHWRTAVLLAEHRRGLRGQRVGHADAAQRRRPPCSMAS